VAEDLLPVGRVERFQVDRAAGDFAAVLAEGLLDRRRPLRSLGVALQAAENGRAALFDCALCLAGIDSEL